MWTSRKAAEPAEAGAPAASAARPGARRGFSLIEALVALVVAGLVLPSLARAFAGAWASARAPMEVVSAMALARDVAGGGPVPPEARQKGFVVERTSGPATVLILPSDVAPAPRGTGKAEQAGDLHPDATPAAFKLALPDGLGGLGAPAAPPVVALRRVSVTVRAPSGRRFALDTVVLDDAPR